ncbi:MAG: tetratricopeptide repeat protein, partial [Planctomycetes bacterium]|nr:tetratricopeptide repeat protein [Planctomycetota bacterium]
MHFRRFHYRAVGRSAMIVALCAAPVMAQEILWRVYLDDGDKAYAAVRYAEAEKLYKLSVTEAENFGRTDPRLALSLNNLAMLYDTQGKYDQAEPLFKRSLAINEKALGPEHPDVAASLNNLAELYRVQGKYDQAEPLYKRSLAIKEKALGPEHPDVALGLNNLAALYDTQGKYDQAEPLYKRSLAIYEKALGPEHP